MESEIKDLTRKALELSADDRAELANTLVESLDAAELRPIDREWAREAQRRRDAILLGSEPTIAGAEALRQVRDAIM
jgi:hypothetical protein